MTLNGWLQIALFSAIILALTKPVGWYLTRTYDGTFQWLGASSGGSTA